jgi:hypothetical protein
MEEEVIKSILAAGPRESIVYVFLILPRAGRNTLLANIGARLLDKRIGVITSTLREYESNYAAIGIPNFTGEFEDIVPKVIFFCEFSLKSPVGVC